MLLIAATAPQEASAQAAQQRPSQTISFNIRSQELGGALNAFADRAGLRLLFPSNLVSGRQSPGLAGSFTREQALARILSGSGLTYRFTGPGTVTIANPSQDQGAAVSGAIRLDTIDVQGAGQGAPVGYVPRNSTAGSKTDTPLLELPQSVSVITPQQLRDQAPQSVQEAVRYTAGVRTEGNGADPRLDWISIRGFTNAGDYRDGLQQQQGSYLRFRTEPYGLDRIDVVKGPVSVLYGQIPPGGLVDRISKRPTETPIHELEVQAGNYDRYQGAFDFGGPIDPEGKFLYRLTGVLRDSNTEIPYAKDDRKFIAPALTWRPDTDTTLTILSSFQEDETGANAQYSPRVSNQDLKSALGQIGALPFVKQPNLWDTYRNTYLGVSGFDRFHQKQYTVGYQFEHHVDDVWTVRQNLRYGHADMLMNFVGVSGFDPSIANLLAGRLPIYRQAYSYGESISAFNIDNQAQAKFNTGPFSHTLLFGVDYQNLTWNQERKSGTASSLNLLAPVVGGTIGALGTTASVTQTPWQLGFYAQDQIKAWDKWVLTLGVRHDSAESNNLNNLNNAWSSQYDRAVTGRAGLTYLADNGLAPYVSWSTSFDPTSGVDFYGNPFKPTTGEQYEAGIKYQPPSWNALFTVAGYQITQQNLVTKDLVNLGASVQTGEVRSRGLEIEGRADLGYGWKTIASFTYQDMVVTSDNNVATVGKTPIFMPRYMASGWIDYTVPSGIFEKLGASFGVRYTGSNFGDSLNQTVNPALTLFDAGVHYERDNWRFAVNVTNLFDKQYEVCTTGFVTAADTTVCSLGYRRHVIGKVTYRW